MAEKKYPVRSGNHNSNYRGGFQGRCTHCSASVWVKPSRAHKQNRFCSKSCHRAWMSANTRGPNGAAWRGGTITSICECCRNPFEARPSQKRQSKAKFCSVTCFGLSTRSERLKKTCDNCGKPFTVRPYRASAKFCCRSCSHAAHRKIRTQDEMIKRRLDLRVSSLMWYHLREGAGKGGRSWKSLVPYTVAELKTHLSTTMPPGFTWDDFVVGKLEIDHKIPRSVFNYSSPEDYDFARCWALDNLQLLTAFDNNSKNAKLSEPFQPSLL